MNDIDFFRLLYSEYKEDLKAVLKYKKNGTNFYHFFTYYIPKGSTEIKHREKKSLLWGSEFQKN